jgi:hypothetical protein
MADDRENIVSKGPCVLCGSAITPTDNTTTAPTLGIKVHTACYQTEYGRREPTRFNRPD